MAPVLGYARSDRIDRSQRIDREDTADANDAPNRPAERSSNENSEDGRPRRGSVASIAKSVSPLTVDEGQTPNIEDYCLGKPKKVAQSHSGVVELYISLQEKAVFLPTVKRRHQHHSHHRNHHTGSENQSSSNSHGRESETLLHESYTDPPPNPEGYSEHELTPDNEHDDYEAHLDHGGIHANSFPDSDPRSVSGSGIHDGGVPDDESKLSGPCSTLRGSVLLKLSKPTKIKEIGVNFYCVSRTLWNLLPQPALFVDSALPNNAQVEDMAYLGIHRWDFVPLEQFGPAQTSYDRLNMGQSSTLIGQDLYGADVAILKDKPNEIQQRKYSRIYNSHACRIRGESSHQVPVFGPLDSQPRKLKLSNVAVDGVLLPAGNYVYNFTLLVDAKTPASVSVPNGQVKFVLGAKIVRTGPFTMNVNGHVDVDVVRAPQELTETGGAGPQNDAVLLSRIWEDRFVYSLNLERRNITLDVPTKFSLTLMPLSEPDVQIHQIQVYASETVTYIYSLDQTIRYADPNLKLLLFEKDAPQGKKGSLLSQTQNTTITTDLTFVSEHNHSPKRAAIEPYVRGRYGELRFLEPDVKGPYIRVKHRLIVVLHVSRTKDSQGNRGHYEVKIDTPVTVLSRHCVSANISLPSYHSSQETAASSDNDTNGNDLPPPSFDDAMAHQLLGPSGALGANPRGTKASFDSTNS